MAMEIERKFLVTSDAWRKNIIRDFTIAQGYLASEKACSIRVRIFNDKANINIKSGSPAISRKEYEYAIALSDAQELMPLCRGPLIEKHRFIVDECGEHWEVDVFSGENQGLVVAELELQHEEQTFQRPPWLGKDVSDDKRYYNVCLVENPFKNWSG